MSVCMYKWYVHVRERERESVCVYMCVYAYMLSALCTSACM
jgi:polyferredoxin